jgi:intermediate peptidase
MASQAMSTCDSLRQALQKEDYQQPLDSTLRATEILHMLDDISKNVCSVIDASELCRCVHASPEWRDSASKAFAILSDYIGQLNADTTLYRALTHVTTSTVFSNLTEEEQRFATLLKAEFERDGIHLPDHERQQVRELQNHVTRLETLFSENITHSTKLFTANASLVERVIPKQLLEQYVPQPTNNNNDPNTVTLSTDAHISDTLGKYSDNPALRKHVYYETNTSCAENLQVLDALIEYRHRVAVRQGFESYADRFLRDKMARNQKNVYHFLHSLQTRILSRGQYRKEMELLSDAKRRVEQVQDGTLEPWDIPFYTGIVKARNGLDISAVSFYLTVGNCLEGMQMMVKRLFGITMSEQEMGKDERWDTLSDANSQARVRKFVFQDETGRSLGTMYFDLHPREGKYQHAAHFTVQCGCVLGGTSSKPEYQAPIVALVCNMGVVPQQGSRLNHHDVETLFHEFGHGLHSLLSRTTFQHLSGTRAAMDFVETPSLLFENYAWDPQFLSLVARHCVTGERIPEDMVQTLIRSRNEFRCIEIQSQILYALFDQALFGVPDPNRVSTTELFAKLHRDNHVPYAEGTHWHSRFGHLVTYGAGYYGYLYSQVFAADIWKRSFQGDSLQRESGECVWRDMLIHGGAKDPNAMLQSTLKREPSVDSFFESMEL